MTSEGAAAAALLLAASQVLAQGGTPAPASSPVPDWAGTWQGELVNLPPRAGAPTVKVTAQIGPWPTEPGACTPWRKTYESSAHPTMTKDYRLCRGAAAGELYVDEGNGVKLDCRLVGDVLVSPFKYGRLVLVVTTRLRGEVLEEEIVTFEDKPAVEGPLSLDARGIQRVSLRRVSR